MSDTVDALVEGHASIARAQFLEVDAVTSLYFERCSEDEKAGRNAAVQGEFVHVEVAFVLSITEYAATRMISLGCDLRLRLHRVSAAFASGEIDLGKATACSDALANVSDDALDLVERLLLDGAAACSSSRLKARARSLIARHDPEGARARRRRAQEDRDVRISAGVDGMSTLDGVLPAVGAQAVAAKLATMSRQVCARDPRTLAQRRADALVAMSQGRSTLACACGTDCGRDVEPASTPSQATILVGVNVSTLLGFDDLPAFLHGYGAIDAELAREIAADGVWRQVLTLSEKDRQILCQNLTGASGFKSGGPVLGVGRRSAAPLLTPAAVAARKRHREERTYRPSAALAQTVRTRDGTCRFPNCGARAENCDLDHTVAFNHANPDRGGLTTEQNLACVCRKHHRLKTFGYWSVRQIGGGELEWVAPTGSVVVTKPRGAFTDPDVRPDEVERFGLTENHVVERLFRCHGRGVEADLEFLLDSTVAGWRRRRKLARAAIPAQVVDEPPPF
ncbi:DUF222 domain-containing protein [Rhodococcus sp. NPDC056743]|uniref:HNH endonuclease signature motif containing protein n=1 Tax=Rhodococcus sp. NPDC056743 TaxID=3345934 RepID=UPI00366C5134